MYTSPPVNFFYKIIFFSPIVYRIFTNEIIIIFEEKKKRKFLTKFFIYHNVLFCFCLFFETKDIEFVYICPQKNIS